MSKRYVVGDIHGRIEALKQVLTLAKFDYQNDKLILLGDIADGGYEVYECVEELLKIKNLVFVIGNHDEMFMNHMRSGWAEDVWIYQGGINTINSYGGKVEDYKNYWEIKKAPLIPVTHQEFFNTAVYYYIEDGKLFVHGGYDPRYPIDKQSKDILTWDRSLIERCKNGLKIKEYDRVFVGHTTTQKYYLDKPIRFGKLIMMDTGAGWDGVLSLLDITNNDINKWKLYQSSKQIPSRDN